MAVAVSVGAGVALQASAPVTVFRGRYYVGAANMYGRTFDVSADGRRFLMIRSDAGSGETAEPTSLVIVQNWQEELKRLAPSR